MYSYLFPFRMYFIHFVGSFSRMYGVSSVLHSVEIINWIKLEKTEWSIMIGFWAYWLASSCLVAQWRSCPARSLTDAAIGSGTSTSGKSIAVPVPSLAPSPALWIFRRRCRRLLQPIFTGFGPLIQFNISARVNN